MPPTAEATYRWAMVDPSRFWYWHVDHEVLLVENVEIMSTLTKGVRSDVSVDVDESLLRGAVSTFQMGFDKLKRPFLTRRRHNGNEPAPIIGALLDVWLSMPWLMGHLLFTEPAAIQAVLENELPNRSAEFKPGPPELLWALAFIEGAEGHFGEELPDFRLAPESGLSPATLAQLDKLYPVPEPANLAASHGEVSLKKSVDYLVSTHGLCLGLDHDNNLVRQTEPKMSLLASCKKATAEERSALLGELTGGAVSLVGDSDKIGEQITLSVAELDMHLPGDVAPGTTEEDAKEADTITLADLIAKVNSISQELQTLKGSLESSAKTNENADGNAATDGQEKVAAGTEQKAVTLEAMRLRHGELMGEVAQLKLNAWVDKQVVALRAANCVRTEQEIRTRLSALKTDEGREQAVLGLMAETADTSVLPGDAPREPGDPPKAVKDQYARLQTAWKAEGRDVPFSLAAFAENHSRKDVTLLESL